MHRIAIILVFMILLSAIPACAQGAPVSFSQGTGASPPAREIWFEDLRDSPEVGDLDKGGAEKVLRAVATALSANEGTAQGELSDLPRTWLADRAPRILFLSASDGRRHARTAIGSGRGLKPALVDALARLRRRGVGKDRARWLKLDVVRRREKRLELLPRGRLDIDRSLEGIAFPRSLGVAFLPDELVSHTILNSEGRFVFRNLIDAILRRGGRPANRLSALGKQPVDAQTFSTWSYFLGDDRFVRLYRGHATGVEISAKVLLESARAAGDYLERAVSSQGKFAYSYLPKTNRVARRYNMVRHAGTIHSMLELYDVTRDGELLDSARRALGYLLDHIKDYAEGERRMAVLVSQGKVKLGGVALAILALAGYVEATGDRGHLEVMSRLGQYVLHSQGGTGKFIDQRYHPSMIARKDFTSEYYPGEAILALMRLHALDPREEWLDGAEKGARYLITVRDAGVPTLELIHDHWLLYGLNELYRQRPVELFLEQVMRIARAITAGQNRDPTHPDWLGSYYEPPRSTPTATRTEGLLAAYALARDHGRREDAKRILESIRLGIGFQLSTQHLPEKVMYLDDPQRTLGGFHRSLTDFEVRIDYVQHNISSLLGYYQLLRGGK